MRARSFDKSSLVRASDLVWALTILVDSSSPGVVEDSKGSAVRR